MPIIHGLYSHIRHVLYVLIDLILLPFPGSQRSQLLYLGVLAHLVCVRFGVTLEYAGFAEEALVKVVNSVSLETLCDVIRHELVLYKLFHQCWLGMWLSILTTVFR